MVCVLCCVFIVFFFKQKTAYEVRISDWSSDVCSSDLGAVAMILASREAGEKAGVKPIARVIASAAAGVPPQIMGIGPVAASKKALARAGLSIKDKIGRAAL